MPTSQPSSEENPSTTEPATKPGWLDIAWNKLDVAWVGAFFLAFGYLWLWQYCRAEGVPLRVHGEALGRLVPWMAAAGLAYALGLAVMVGMPVMALRAKGIFGDRSVGEALTPRHLEGDDPWRAKHRALLRVIAGPAAAGVLFFIAGIALGWEATSLVFAALGATVAVQLLVLRSWKDERATPFRGELMMDAVVVAWLFWAALLLIPSFIWIVLTRAMPMPAFWFIKWCLIILSVIGIFGLTMTLMSMDAREMRHRFKSSVLMVLLGGLVVSCIPPMSESLGRMALQAMNLGGNLGVVIELSEDGWKNLPPLDRVRRVDGQQTVKARLILDTGGELYLRPACLSGLAAASQRTVIVPWDDVVALHHTKITCDEAVPFMDILSHIQPVPTG
jgi:hypothetical protein